MNSGSATTNKHVFPVCVYYEDTDHTGVVYHANYLKYFERAREHMFGLTTVAELYRQQGLGLVVHKLTVTYKAPAIHGETLEVHSAVSFASEYRAVFQQNICRQGMLYALVKGTIDLVAVNQERTLIPIPEPVKEILAPWTMPLSSP